MIVVHHLNNSHSEPVRREVLPAGPKRKEAPADLKCVHPIPACDDYVFWTYYGEGSAIQPVILKVCAARSWV
jgi:hypothetical protein